MPPELRCRHSASYIVSFPQILNLSLIITIKTNPFCGSFYKLPGPHSRNVRESGHRLAGSSVPRLTRRNRGVSQGCGVFWKPEGGTSLQQSSFPCGRVIGGPTSCCLSARGRRKGLHAPTVPGHLGFNTAARAIKPTGRTQAAGQNLVSWSVITGLTSYCLCLVM